MSSAGRRSFLKLFTFGIIVMFLPLSNLSSIVLNKIFLAVNAAIQVVIEIIQNLRSEGSSIVLKTLNGRKYIINPDEHYPYEDSIEDPDTSCQCFFHAHRDNEYGHFHTFINNSKGELVHLIMISMDKDGIPFELSTLNTWITGETYVNADELKKLVLKFKINHDLFPDKRIAEFIESLFIGYNEVITELFEERDQFIKQYILNNNSNPFEDENIEIISSRKIDIYQDVKKYF